jgi:hypothetical protein
MAHRPGQMLPEYDLVSRCNTHDERYHAKMSHTSSSVNISFLPAKTYYTSDMLLDQCPLQEPSASIYSTKTASIRWLCVSNLATSQQHVMKAICPELAPLRAVDGMIFPDLPQAQMCLHDTPGMLLFLRAFETSMPLSASFTWVQQCLQLVDLLFSHSTAQLALCYSVRRSQFALLTELDQLAVNRIFCSMISYFDYQEFSCAIEGVCACVLLSKIPFRKGKPFSITSESKSIGSCLSDTPA